MVTSFSEELEVPSFYASLCTVFALLAEGKTIGIVIDPGGGVMSATRVF